MTTSAPRIFITCPACRGEIGLLWSDSLLMGNGEATVRDKCSVMCKCGHVSEAGAVLRYRVGKFEMEETV